MSRGDTRNATKAIVGLSTSNPPEEDLAAEDETVAGYVAWVCAVVVGLIDADFQVAYAGDDRPGGITEAVSTALQGRSGFLPIRQLAVELTLAEARRATADEATGWIAVGGARSPDGEDGVTEEIELAIRIELPTVICTHFGGAAVAALDRFEAGANLVEVASDDPAEAVLTVRRLVEEDRR